MQDTGYLSAIDQSFNKKSKKVKKTKHSACSPSFTTSVEKITMKDRVSDIKSRRPVRKSKTIVDMFR